MENDLSPITEHVRYEAMMENDEDYAFFSTDLTTKITK